MESNQHQTNASSLKLDKTQIKRLIVMRGLPASGKSTAAKEACDQFAYKRINFDLLREMLDFGQWSKKNEKFLHKAAKAIAKLAFDDGKTVVMDNTNLSSNQTSLNESISTENKVPIDVKDFTWVPVQECIDRDARRGDKSVGSKVILDMYNSHIRSNEFVPYNPGLSDCIIVDLDGTLAENNSGRNPYGGDDVYQDDVRNHVLIAVKAYFHEGYKVFFMSGREDCGKCRSETIRWLADKCGFDFRFDDFVLAMRRSGDSRKDSIVKRELYEALVKDKYNVTAIFDDRQQVVELYDQIGLGDRIFRCGRIFSDDF